MEELETLYKPIPAYSTNEYKVAGRNIHIDKTEAFKKMTMGLKAMRRMKVLNYVSELMDSEIEIRDIGLSVVYLPHGIVVQDIKDLWSMLAKWFDKKKETECMDVSKLKKQIKHCKNPLERKALERQLNKAYKKRKQKNG